MGSSYTNSEIIEKLKWFHGEDFDKYPLVDGFFEEKNEKLAEAC